MTKINLSQHPAVRTFYEENPDFYLLNFDLNDNEAIAQLTFERADKETSVGHLRIFQRLLRVTDDAGAIDKLIADGYTSAHRIASDPAHRFVRKYAGAFAGGAEEARAVHRRAAHVKAAVAHVFANVHGMVASHHYRAMLASHVPPPFSEYFEEIPSYQDLFGGLNYCVCKECQSIFGPAAYFLDIMRITDDYITEPNTTKEENNIPAGYTLQERRPDLFDLDLDCDNTNDLIPYLRIVNTVLERRIERERQVTSGTAQGGAVSSITLAAAASSEDDAYAGMTVFITGGTGTGQSQTITGYAGESRVAAVGNVWKVVPDDTSQYSIAEDSYQTLAAARYPFNLPFNLLLEQIRQHLNALNVSLSGVYKYFNAPVTGGTAAGGTSSTITLDASASSEDGAYVARQVALIGGAGAGQSKSITAYDGTTKVATVAVAWTTPPDDTTQYHIFDDLGAKREYLGLSVEQYDILITRKLTFEELARFYGYDDLDLEPLTRVDTFLERTGLTREHLDELLTQGLSESELAAGLANVFFINATGDDKPYMRIVLDDSDKKNSFYRIDRLTPKRLDRLNRFIRLARHLDWKYAALNWALVSVRPAGTAPSAIEIDRESLAAISGIKELQDLTGLDVVELCSLWYEMKYIGRGDGKYPADLFDVTFNNPALLRGEDPYTSISPTPFDPSDPLRFLLWDIDDQTGRNGKIRARLLGALAVSDDDLTKLGHYVLSLLGHADSAPLPMSPANLTWLYRLPRTASLLKLTVDEYLLLLGLMYYPEEEYLSPPAGVLVPSVEAVHSQRRAADWFKQSGLTVYSASYVLTGKTSQFFKTVYSPGEIASFINNLATVSAGGRVQPAALVFGRIDADRSERVFRELVEKGFLSDIGVVLNDSGSYLQAAAEFPLTPDSFQTGGITPDEAAQIYTELQQSNPPILIAQQSGGSILSQSFTRATNLDFILVGDEDEANKRNEVRLVLLETKRKIDITIFAFLLPLTEDSFVRANISGAESLRSFQSLTGQDPPVIVENSASGESATITGYDGATRTATLDALWKVTPDGNSLYQIIQTVNSGTARGGTLTTITLAADASPDDEAYTGMSVEITGAAGAGQTNVITAYDGTSNVASVASPWPIAPDETSAYVVKGVETQGAVRGASASSVVLAADASAVNDAYNGMTVAIVPSGTLSAAFDESTPLDFLFTSKGSGQSRLVTAYDGATRTATLDSPWDKVIPDDTSFYSLTVEGTAQGGTTTTITLAADASSTDDAYRGMSVEVTGGAGAGQTNNITAYDGKTKAATVTVAWTTPPDNTSTYELQEEGTARGGSASSLLLAPSTSAADYAYLGMTLTIVDTPDADTKRNEAKLMLLAVRDEIEHTAGVVTAAEFLQENNAVQGLANLLRTAPDMLRALLGFAAGTADLSDYAEELLTPLDEGQTPPSVSSLVAILSRALVLFDALDFSAEEVRAVVDMPRVFNVVQTNQLTFDDLRGLVAFKSLATAFDAHDRELISYFALPDTPDITKDSPKVSALAALTHWDAGQIVELIKLFWPDGEGESEYDYTTVAGVSRLKQSFDLGARAGLDVKSLLRFEALSELSLVDGDDNLIAANWKFYEEVASVALGAVSARLGAAEFAEADAGMVGALEELRRDALRGYAIWLLGQTNLAISKAADLYQYLLIDVEMSGCDSLSLIAQGIASVQLYMQRCRMMLEPGVTDLSNIPEIWWEWMSGYRVWEANRKIFLYPENYIEPALRSGQTPPFKGFVDSLLQTDISDKTVSKAYTDYFTDFSTVANLVNCVSYACKIEQPSTTVVYAQGAAVSAATNTITLATDSSSVYNRYYGMSIRITGGTGKDQVRSVITYNSADQTAQIAPDWEIVPDNTSTYVITGPQEVDTLFLIGCTNTEPSVLYYRTLSGGSTWTPWTKIDQTIPTSLVTPVYSFNKLFLFWVEQKTLQSSAFVTGDSSGSVTPTPISDTTSTIKYTYLDSDGTWAAPQVLASNVVVYYETNYQQPDPYLSQPFTTTLFNPDSIFLQKVYALQVPVQMISPTGIYPAADSIFVNYGFMLPVLIGQTNGIVGLEAPATNTPPDQYAIEQNFYEALIRFNALANTPPSGAVEVFVQVLPSFVIQSSLTNGQVNTALFGLNSPSSVPQPYCPVLIRTPQLGENSQLGMTPSSSWSTAIDNYVLDDYAAFPLGNTQAALRFTPLLGNISGLTANLVTVKNLPGSFIFDNGNEAFLVTCSDKGIQLISDTMPISTNLTNFPSGQYYLVPLSFTSTTLPPPLNELNFTFLRLSTHVVEGLLQNLKLSGISGLLTLDSQKTPERSFSGYLPTTNVIPPETDHLDFNGPYGLYFWEVFFYAPFLVANSLHVNQRFEEAKTWYEYIFNPTQQPDGDEEGSRSGERFWRFLPFRPMTMQTLVQILSNPAQQAAYNDDPFDPDAIARLRMAAYAKAVVMKYIDNLIAWGDNLFAQDTRESITQATNLYVMASDLLGPRPVSVGPCPSSDPKNFNDIKEEYNDKTVATGTAQGGGSSTITLAASASDAEDAYTGMNIAITAGTGSGQQGYITAYGGVARLASVDLEWATVPDNTSQYRIYLNGIPQFLISLENSGVVTPMVDTGIGLTDSPFNDINSYFCIPENSELIGYWDRVEDRLFKIRHCMNMEGQVRSLSQFAPPIDPRVLIRAARGGAGSLSLLSSLAAPVPNYRFDVLIAKATSLASALTQLGGSLLSAIEKRDAEALALLRTSQEKALLDLTTFIKEQQIEQFKQMKLSLDESQKSAQKRFDYYTSQLAGGLSLGEVENIAKMKSANNFTIASTATRMAASIAYILPQLGSPFAMTYGGVQLGAALTAASGVTAIFAELDNFKAQMSLTMAGYARRASEWQLQADLAAIDQLQIGYQIEANDTSQKISERELEVHRETIKQNEAMDAFLKTKFTNEELYQWMMGRLSTIYFQTYSLAHELALSAQRAYQYELNTEQTFIDFGYWDSLRNGLLAGEGLTLALNQLEKAYLDNTPRLLEIEKTVSLLQLNPRALLDLLTRGECVFELSEKLFDDDFPGHYARKIKTVSISVPAVVGPYQNIHATLTQLSNRVVIKPDVHAVNFLLGGEDAVLPGADVLRSNWRVNQQIAISRGLDDAGMFALDFNDARYLPFEGTGAVSVWRLSMPKATNRINFKNISDVIIQLKYTAIDGGSKFREDVTRLDAMKEYRGSTFFLAAQTFSSQWYTFLNVHPDTATQSLDFELDSLTPEHVDEPVLTGFYLQLDVAAGIKTTGANDYLRLKLGDAVDVTFNLGGNNAYLHTFRAGRSLESAEGAGSLSFTLADTPPDLKTTTAPSYLDAGVIKNIVLILFYRGEIRWS